MRKLFFLLQAAVLFVIIPICSVSLTLIPVQDAYSQEQQQQLPIDEIFKMVENSTVGIIRERNDGSNLEFDGTGFVYDAGVEIPYIVTNAHVVERLKRVEVSFTDGSIYKAEVKGIDPQGDIAVLQIIGNVTSRQQQPPSPLEIGNSSELQVGEQVIAIGNQFLTDQSYANLLTSGVISKLGVKTEYDTKSSILNAIVTDAAIAMGSSGGPLINLKGEVIGMTTTSDDDTPCCTYAIPSNTIKHIVPILVETGKYIHPWLGLTTATLTSDIAERDEGLEPNFKGVLVHSIVNNGPADKAGLKDIIINENNETGTIGDIITAIDGEPVTTADEFNAYIDEHKFVGNNITLSIYRSGQILNLPVTLGQNPDFSSNDK